MLDDRLTTAGAALRQVPAPPVGLGALRHRRRTRTARRLGALIVAVVALAVAVVRVDVVRPTPIEMLDRIEVPTPVLPTQLLPDRVPAGWALSSWVESDGITFGISPPPRLHLFGASGWFADRPYVAVVQTANFQPGTMAPTTTVNGLPAVLADEANGLRRLTFWEILQGDGVFPVARSASVFGWRVPDAELRAVAAGIRFEGEGIRIRRTPAGMATILSDVLAIEDRPLVRTFTWRRAGATVELEVAPATGATLDQILWLHPGVRRGQLLDHTIARAAGEGVEWRWRQAGDTVVLRGQGVTENVLREFAERLRPRPAADLGRYVGSIPATTMWDERALQFRVPVIDFRLAGKRFRLEAWMSRSTTGEIRLCARGCTPLPSDREPLALWQLSSPLTTYVVTSAVDRVVVEYRDGTTLVLRPVQVAPRQPRVVAVPLLDGDLDVESITALDANGEVLDRPTPPDLTP